MPPPVLPSPKEVTWAQFLSAGRKAGYSERTLSQAYADSTGTTVQTSAGPVKPSATSGKVPVRPAYTPSGAAVAAGPSRSGLPSSPFLGGGGLTGNFNPIPFKPTAPNKHILISKPRPYGGPSSDMPGEHSGSRIDTQPDRPFPTPGAPGGGRLQPRPNNGRVSTRVERPDDGGLADIIEAINNQGSPGFAYRDFTNQARNQVSGIYQPQYQAFEKSKSDAQANYGRNDATIAGLYAQLASGLNAQKQGAKTDNAGLIAGNQADVAADTTAIGKAYSGSQGQLMAMLKNAGIEDAAPDVLAPGAADQAWQQGQTRQGAALQKDYLTNSGTNVQNYLTGLGNASAQQGIADRETLIGNLAKQLADYDRQVAELKTREGENALSLAQQLSQQDYGMQKDNYVNPIDKLLKIYELETNQEDRSWDRANTTADQRLANRVDQRAQEQHEATLNQLPEIEGSEFQQFADKMVNTYGEKGGLIGTIVGQVAAAVGDPEGDLNDVRNNARFNNEVVKAVQRALGPNATNADSLAAQEWAKFYMDQLNFSTTGSYAGG